MNLGRIVGGLALAALALTGFQQYPTAAEATTPTVVPAAAVRVTQQIPACGSLPAEADSVISDIHNGGPYDYPNNDGVTFNNREGLLADEASGYYREFTVETPGSDDRGARRIVTGGPEETNPEHWYYTDDHYESFCEFSG